MKVCVVGTGYVGLTVAVALAARGHGVRCVDKDRSKVRQLSSGRPTFFEPGIADYLSRGVQSGALTFTSSLRRGLAGADMVFVTVSTPAGPDGRADLSALYEVADGLVEHGRKPVTVVIKSTVPVGTGDRLEGYLRERTGREWHVVSNPEFLREGSALSDYMNPDRIVIGAASSDAAEQVRRLYSDFQAPILIVDRRTAELTKYAANGLLATKISFINEIADLCERLDVDVTEVSQGVGLDHRIGPHGLRAGLGYGGSCFPKDVAALIAQFRNNGCHPRILEAVQAVNRERRTRFVQLVTACCGGLEGRRFAVWGLAFKPGTDDVREAPALDIVPALLAGGAALSVYDPAVGNRAAALFPGVAVAPSAMEAAAGADAVLLLTDWDEFRTADLARLRAVMARPLLIDGRNVFSPAVVQGKGLEYYGLGRGSPAGGRSVKA